MKNEREIAEMKWKIDPADVMIDKKKQGGSTGFVCLQTELDLVGFRVEGTPHRPIP